MSACKIEQQVGTQLWLVVGKPATGWSGFAKICNRLFHIRRKSSPTDQSRNLQQVVGQFSETDPSKNWLNKFCNNLKVAKNHWQSICQKVGFQHLIKVGLLEQLQLCRMHASYHIEPGGSGQNTKAVKIPTASLVGCWCWITSASWFFNQLIGFR